MRQKGERERCGITSARMEWNEMKRYYRRINNITGINKKSTLLSQLSFMCLPEERDGNGGAKGVSILFDFRTSPVGSLDFGSGPTLLLSHRPLSALVVLDLFRSMFVLLLWSSDWFVPAATVVVAAVVAVAAACAAGDFRTGGVGNIILLSLRSVRSIRSIDVPLLLSPSKSGRYNAPLSKLFESRFCMCKWWLPAVDKSNRLRWFQGKSNGKLSKMN